MSCSWCLQSYLLVIFDILHVVWTVPPEYCLLPFNGSDCNLPPRHVFAYYKPGSRCELEVWRGCPTPNKFENEYLCSMSCIFRSRNYASSEIGHECASPLNTVKCKNETQTVYTHVDGRCIEAEWGGCQTYNKFHSKAECDEKCLTVNGESNSGSAEESVILYDINELLKHLIGQRTENTTTEETTTKETTTEETTTKETTTEEITTEETTTEVFLAPLEP